MKRKEPILFNPERPLDHYERAHKLKKKIDNTLYVSRIIAIVAFLTGAVCAALNPAMMAANALFGLLFAIFAYCGCWLKRSSLCLVSLPLGIAAAFAAVISGSEYASVGAGAFAVGVILQALSISRIYDYVILKELPGFPFFDVTMDEITFAAKDRFGSDEFIDESRLHEEKVRPNTVVLRKPSNEMKDLSTPDVPELTPKEIRKMEGDKVWTYEHHRENDMSDVDLFE